PSPTRRASDLRRTVPGMEDGAAEVRPQVRELVEPFSLEAVFAQRLVLAADLDAFFDVGREAQAAGSPEGASGQRLQPVERRLGSAPQLARSLGTVGLACHVVPGRGAAQRETAVATARAGP